MSEAGSPMELAALSLGLAVLLGGTFVWLCSRDRKTDLALRIVTMQMGLLFLVNSVIFIIGIITSTSGNFGLSEDFANGLKLSATFLNLFTLSQICSLALIFPMPIFEERGKLLLAVSVTVLYVLFSILLTYFFFSSIFMTAWLIGFFLLIVTAVLVMMRWYLLYRDSDDLILRNHAVAAALLMFAMFGGSMIRWPSMLNLDGFQIMSQNLVFGPYDLPIGVVMFAHISDICCVVGLFFITWKEISLLQKKRDSVLLSIACIYFLFGFINLLVLRFSSPQGSFLELWNYFAVVGMFGLIRPVLIVYIAFRFNLFNLSDEKLRSRIKIIALLLATVWTSSLFEIVQAFLPMPQLLSAALIGVMLAFVIGWEERIFENLASDSDKKMLIISNDLFIEEDIFRLPILTIVCVVFFISLAILLGGESF